MRLVSYSRFKMRKEKFSNGDEVVIFLNKDGFSWGEQSVLKINNGKTIVNNHHQGKMEYSISELKKKLKEHLNNSFNNV